MEAGFKAATALAGLLAAFTPAPTGAQAAGAWRIAIIGDSLATGYGIGREAAYPAVLERLAHSEGWPVQVGVWGRSGNTTQDGIASARDAAAWAPHIAVIALGGNDALQGAPAASVRINVDRILAQLQPFSGYLLVAGMRAPPFHGEAYAERFHAAFRDAATAYGAAWMPFLLDGVAGRPELNQTDGVHPNEAGSQIIGASLWAYVREALHALLQRYAQRQRNDHRAGTLQPTALLSFSGAAPTTLSARAIHARAAPEERLMNRRTGGLAAPYHWRVVGADGETLCAPSRGLARGPAAVHQRLSDARRIARTLRRHGHAAAVVPYAKVERSAVEYASTHDDAWK